MVFMAEAGKMHIEFTDVNLRTTVEDVLDLFAERTHRKGLTLASFISPELPDWIITDPDRLSQVLCNLLSNSAKFTIQGHITITVTAQPRSMRSSTLQPGTAGHFTPERAAEYVPTRCRRWLEPKGQQLTIGRSMCGIGTIAMSMYLDPIPISCSRSLTLVSVSIANE